jgi:hypothetical protein
LTDRVCATGREARFEGGCLGEMNDRS